MRQCVRVAAPDDVREIVRVHTSAFPGFLLTDLGTRFLSLLYRGFVIEESGILLVAESPLGTVVGLLAGTRDPDHFFRTLLMHRGFALVLASIPGLLRHPIRIGERLMAAVRYRGDRPARLEGYWLLSSLGITREMVRSGIGASLVDQFCRIAAEDNAPGVYLITDLDNNDATLNFYAKRQFVVHSRCRRRNGRHLLVLTRKIAV